MKKGYLQISFGWPMLISLGAVILFLAILFATRLINIGQNTGTAQTSKEIEILLNPLETSFESSKTTSFAIGKETRIYNKCSDEDFFGKQKIQTSQKTFNKWSDTGVDVSFENKYIFSEKEVEGKKFYVFSKPFDFPFKIADLIYLSSSTTNYCFVSPPFDIENELSQLEQENLFFEDCPENSIDVCFNLGSNCDINVNYNGGYVKKQGTNLYFEGDALMYAAVFADNDIYECQIQRLMKKVEQLSLLYREKENLIPRECESNLGGDLVRMSNSAGSFSDSESLNSIKNIADVLENKNDLAACSLW